MTHPIVSIVANTNLDESNERDCWWSYQLQVIGKLSYHCKECAVCSVQCEVLSVMCALCSVQIIVLCTLYHEQSEVSSKSVQCIEYTAVCSVQCESVKV